MKNASIGVIEGDKLWRDLFDFPLKHAGHAIVMEAMSVDEAREFIGRLEKGSMDVAIVDGNLSGQDADGNYGAEIVRLLRVALGEEVCIIGSSGSNKVEGADYNVSKADNAVARIIDIIDEL